MRWAATTPIRRTLDARTDIQTMGERLLAAETERHHYLIVGPVTVTVVADMTTDNHTLHAEADIITQRMPARGRK